MGEKRIVCIGTGNRLTSPSSISAENGRFYRYPNPGMIHSWEGDATTFEESVLPKHELAAAYPGGPAIQGYGLIILGDTYMHLLKTSLESEGFVPRRVRANDFDTKIDPALERARTIEGDWKNYGAFIIAGQLPTENELMEARGRRKTYAGQRLLEYERTVKSNRRVIPSGSEEAWAAEFGWLLPQTLGTMQKAKLEVVEDTPCPECQNFISAQARKCRHCQATFGKALVDFLTEPDDAMEPKRGPGRPRKEAVMAETR